NQGTLVRTSADGVSVLSRNTQGVKLIGLRGDEILSGVQRIEESASDETDLAEAPADPADEE
ncbi:MAG: DNA gyrase C-terminal beta-propeller domain-containing protein, partial [Pseudomonadales bacterium]